MISGILLVIILCMAFMLKRATDSIKFLVKAYNDLEWKYRVQNNELQEYQDLYEEERKKNRRDDSEADLDLYQRI